MRNRTMATSQSRPVQHEFGKSSLSHGWIQCRSKRYPKRLYFHNVNSGCNTWNRPISRYVNVPTLNTQDISDENNVTENSLELVSLSDDDKQPKIKRKSHIVITEQNCDTSGKCYALQVGLTVDTTDDSYESDRSTTFQWETTKCFIKNRRNVNTENSDNSDSSEAIRLPLHDMKSYRKKRITVSPVLTSSRRVVSHPRKTSGNRSTIKRKQPPVVSKSREPRKIVCDMFGVKTTNYFYSPDPDSGDQTCAKIQVRCSTLSDSEESLSPRNDDSRTSENQSTVKCKQAHPVVSQNRQPVRIKCLRLSDSDSDSDAQS